VIAEYFERRVLELRGLRRQCRGGFGGHLLLVGGFAKRAPHRHGALPRTIDFCVGVEAGLYRKGTCTFPEGIGSHGIAQFEFSAPLTPP
jgi:hypothetical protein